MAQESARSLQDGKIPGTELQVWEEPKQFIVSWCLCSVLALGEAHGRDCPHTMMGFILESPSWSNQKKKKELGYEQGERSGELVPGAFLASQIFPQHPCTEL